VYQGLVKTVILKSESLGVLGNPNQSAIDAGRCKEAEQLEVQVFGISKTKLGEVHPSTLTRMANLAFMFESTGCLSEAIGFLTTCVTNQQRILGPAHRNTVSNSALHRSGSDLHASLVDHKVFGAIRGGALCFQRLDMHVCLQCPIVIGQDCLLAGLWLQAHSSRLRGLRKNSVHGAYKLLIQKMQC
jgi:hypothetical protein